MHDHEGINDDIDERDSDGDNDLEEDKPLNTLEMHCGIQRECNHLDKRHDDEPRLFTRPKNRDGVGCDTVHEFETPWDPNDG